VPFVNIIHIILIYLWGSILFITITAHKFDVYDAIWISELFQPLNENIGYFILQTTQIDKVIFWNEYLVEWLFIHYNLINFIESEAPLGSGLEQVLRIPMRVVRGDWMGRSFEWDRKNRGPVSQQVRHDFKDPSLLKGPERRA
jgi:hypothetical protein